MQAMLKNLGISVVVVAALCASLALGCNKASEKTSTTETTSAEINVNGDLGTAPARAPKDDYLATVRREQLVLRSRIEETIAALDHEISDLRKATAPNTAAIQELLTRRQTLEADATVVGRSDERGWDELKATVEHDLEDRPSM